jgi:hypothetical protein
MKRKNERGQAILEMAVILPVFVLVGLGLADMQWSLGKVSSLEYVVNETARCQAIDAVPCMEPPNTPEKYAMAMGQNLHLNPPQLVFVSAGCNVVTGLCTATMTYHYQPLGAYFPEMTIQRTGTAALPK